MRVKRAKWDNAGALDPGVHHVAASVPPKPEDLRQKAEAAAARIVAQIKEDKAQSEDVFINDHPNSIRDQLTRRAALVYVEQQTGTSIVIKGRYYPPGAYRDNVNPPLHLHITPQQHLSTDNYHRRNAVARAAAHVHAILRGEATLVSPVPPYVPQGGMAPPPDLTQTGQPSYSVPHMQQYPEVPHSRYMHEHGGLAHGPGQSMHAPGPHPGMPPQPPVHAMRPMAAGPCIGNTMPTGAGLGPPPVARATSTSHAPQGQLHPTAHPSWQEQQDWAEKQHRTPRHGAAAGHWHGSAPPRYHPASSSVNGASLARPPPPDAHPSVMFASNAQAARSEPASGAAVQSDQAWGTQAGAPPDGDVAALPVDFPVPAGFDVLSHIWGPDRSYVAHIEQETGVSIDVIDNSGRPQASCPVSVHVVAREPWKRNAAVELVQSLLETVKASAETCAVTNGHAAPQHDYQALPNHYSAARAPLPQFQHAGEGAHASCETDGGSFQHDGYLQPRRPQHAGMHEHHSEPPQGFSEPDRQMQGQHPPVTNEAPRTQHHEHEMLPRRRQNGTHFETAARQQESTLRSTVQPPPTGAAAAAGYRSSTRVADEQQAQEKPAKRKFREFKEEPGGAQAPPEKRSEDSTLPSYYQHLREASCKQPPPDVAQHHVEAERPPAGAAPALGYSQVYGQAYGPQIAPAGGRNRGHLHPEDAPYAEDRLGSGPRSGLGARGSGAAGSLGLVPYGDD